MADDLTSVFAPILKTAPQADGSLLVYGKATGPDLDLDQQRCDASWLARAVPEWFKVGNIREQHDAHRAVGKATEHEARGDDHYITAKIVDPVAVAKAKAGVFTGFSIGIKSPRIAKSLDAPRGVITDGQICEVSIVDAPCLPTATLTLAKAVKPGPPAVAPGTVDHERMLVKVEELHEDQQADRSGEVLDALKALELDEGDLAKARNARDVKDAKKAIAIIARLIQSEAEQLAGDVAYEACDIELLLSAVRALDWFKCREKKEEPMAHVEMAAEATAEKSAAPAPTAAATPAPAAEAPGTETPAPPVEKAAEGEDKTDLTELVKALGAEVSDLKGQLTKALSTPAPGGPVLTRTVEDTTKAGAREAHLTKAAEYERLAYEVTDSQARAGYLQLADDARAAATS